jgi:hypothetical protein
MSSSIFGASAMSEAGLAGAWYHRRVRPLSTYFPMCISLLSMCCLNRLVEILKHKPGAQMNYQVGFCLWLLSFEQLVAEEINK